MLNDSSATDLVSTDARESKKPSQKKTTHIDQPTAVSEYFTLPVHSIDNMYIELVPLELIISNRDAIRKGREAFLISKGKITIEPFGLNRREEI